MKFKMNFSFEALERGFDNLIKEEISNLTKDFAEQAKKNIMDGLSPPLKKSTIAIRKFKGLGSGTKPLKYSGALYDSIKNTATGVEMLEYGWNHNKGFKPSKIPTYKGMVKNTYGITVPKREFILESKRKKERVSRFAKNITRKLTSRRAK